MFDLLVTLHMFLASRLRNWYFPCLLCILGELLIILLFRWTVLLPYHPIISCSLDFHFGFSAEQICFIAQFILHLIFYGFVVIFCYTGSSFLAFLDYHSFIYILELQNSVVSMPISPIIFCIEIFISLVLNWFLACKSLSGTVRQYFKAKIVPFFALMLLCVPLLYNYLPLPAFSVLTQLYFPAEQSCCSALRWLYEVSLFADQISGV